MKHTQSPFNAEWISFGLEDLIDLGENTYMYAKYENLPPVDENKLDGKFEWLRPLSIDRKKEMAMYQNPKARNEMAEKLTKLGTEATLLGLKLPEEFVFFMSDQKLQDEIPSNTACYFKLSENIIPSPLAKGDYFIQFLNDQQDVIFWYLYLRTDGEHSVVASPVPLFDTEVLKDITVEILLKEVVHCSDSFKEFIYRYWVENRIWFGLEEGDEMTDEMEQYIAHFK